MSHSYITTFLFSQTGVTLLFHIPFHEIVIKGASFWSTFSRTTSTAKALCSSSDDWVSACQVMLCMNTAGPSKAAWHGSRGHQDATPDKQQQPRALISRPVCSTVTALAPAFSADMVWQADTDDLRCTDRVCVMRELCRSDADTGSLLFIHFPRWLSIRYD